MAGIVWVLREVRHIVEASTSTTIIYTDYGATLGIATQNTLTSTDKLNLRLVRASDYIQRFDLELRHKSGKQHIVPDALSRLVSDNENPPPHSEGELDALLTVACLRKPSADLDSSLQKPFASPPVPQEVHALTVSLVQMDAEFPEAHIGWLQNRPHLAENREHA